MGNQYGYLCPRCGGQDDLSVDAIVRVEAELWEDGVDHDVAAINWDENSAARCHQCEWCGVVNQLIQVAPGDQSLGVDDIPEIFWFPSQGWALSMVEDRFGCHIEAVSIDEWCDNKISLSLDQIRFVAKKSGLLLDEDGRLVGFAKQRGGINK